MKQHITHTQAVDVLTCQKYGFIREIIEDYSTKKLQILLQSVGFDVEVWPQIRDVVRR